MYCSGAVEYVEEEEPRMIPAIACGVVVAIIGINRMICDAGWCYYRWKKVMPPLMKYKWIEVD